LLVPEFSAVLEALVAAGALTLVSLEFLVALALAGAIFIAELDALIEPGIVGVLAILDVVPAVGLLGSVVLDRRRFLRFLSDCMMTNERRFDYFTRQSRHKVL
jgi:hypothetical protein